MSPESRRVILDALARHKGDNFARAKHAFSNCTPEQMDQQYGQSGMTRREIMAEYQAHADACDKAVLEVAALS